MAEKLGLKTVPELYIQNGNGTLNAFATCMPGYRAFGVIYADILERALATTTATRCASSSATNSATSA